MEDSGHTPEWTGPKVERTLSNGKRIYVTAFKAWMVEQARRPDISVAGLALRNGLNANLLRHWMNLGHWQGQAPALLPVTIAAEPASCEVAAATRAYPSSGTMEIELCGAVVRLSGEIDAAQLKTVLAVLRS
jgi:transposase